MTRHGRIVTATPVFTPCLNTDRSRSRQESRRPSRTGQLALRGKVFRCWPSEYVALGALDANNGGAAIESLVLQNEGWERDVDVPEPTQPSFGAP